MICLPEIAAAEGSELPEGGADCVTLEAALPIGAGLGTQNRNPEMAQVEEKQEYQFTGGGCVLAAAQAAMVSPSQQHQGAQYSRLVEQPLSTVFARRLGPRLLGGHCLLLRSAQADGYP